MKILPPEHMKAYLNAAEARSLLPMFYLELVSSLRKGELVALRWEDLDIQQRTISVSKQYVRNPDGSLELTRPKTENSVRLVSIPQTAVDLLIQEHAKHPNSPYTKSLTAANPSALIPSLGLSKLFAGEKTVTIAIPLAILMAVLVWVILNKTKFGYELKATGFNFNAAKYCGMKENRNVILTMVIAGGLAGMGAGLYYLTGIEDWETTISSVPGMGFNGIAVAFLGGLSPFGSILASFFIQHITTGGGNVDLTVYSPQISSLISSLIIFLCAFSGFLKERLQASLRKGDERRAARAKLAEEQKGGAQK